MTQPFARPVRHRRLRQSGWVRDLVREHQLSAHDFIYPIFLTQGTNIKEPVDSLPGINRLSINKAVEIAKHSADLGIPALALFPATPKHKRNETGSHALDEDNLMCRALDALKHAVPEIGLMADVALDPYTSHGQDGLVKNGQIVNDETVEILVKQSILQARAGADMIAPSDMMDGRIAQIRAGLDDHGFEQTLLISYAAKYASAYYAPFREAIGSGGVLTGDKKTYQMDPANSDEALKEIQTDLDEGADMIIVKPGQPYLDIVANAKASLNVPLVAYQVSGEYAMIKAAAQKGWIDEGAAMMEALIGFKRAGCSAVITYFALDAARLLNG